MLKFIRCAVVALMLAPAAGAAQDFDDGMKAFKAKDYATALQEWRPLAEQGHASAQYTLGVMNDTGEGVALDHVKAVRWYRMAAEQGHASAQYNLAVMHYNGEGILQNDATAHMWFNIAAANGDDHAAEQRNFVASRMTTADISRAQRRARVCMKSGYQDCD